MQNISEVKNLKNLHGEKTQMKTGSSNRYMGLGYKT